jgi:hypothetical protein
MITATGQDVAFLGGGFIMNGILRQPPHTFNNNTGQIPDLQVMPSLRPQSVFCHNPASVRLIEPQAIL